MLLFRLHHRGQHPCQGPSSWSAMAVTTSKHGSVESFHDRSATPRRHNVLCRSEWLVPQLGSVWHIILYLCTCWMHAAYEPWWRPVSPCLGSHVAVVGVERQGQSWFCSSCQWPQVDELVGPDHRFDFLVKRRLKDQKGSHDWLTLSGPELGYSRHLLEAAGHHVVKVWVLVNAGRIWLLHKHRDGRRSCSRNRRGAIVAAASPRQLGLSFLQLALQVVNGGAQWGGRCVTVRALRRVRAVWLFIYQSRRHPSWPRGASACRWRAEIGKHSSAVFRKYEYPRQIQTQCCDVSLRQVAYKCLRPSHNHLKQESDIPIH